MNNCTFVKKGIAVLNFRQCLLIVLFFDGSRDKSAVNVLLQEKEYHKRRDDAEDNTCEYYLPLYLGGADVLIKHCRHHQQPVVLHIELRGVEIIVDADEFDYQHRGDGGHEVRQDYRKVYAGIACSVHNGAFVKRC